VPELSCARIALPRFVKQTATTAQRSRYIFMGVFVGRNEDQGLSSLAL
jgi:hypothetical protein